MRKTIIIPVFVLFLIPIFPAASHGQEPPKPSRKEEKKKRILQEKEFMLRQTQEKYGKLAAEKRDQSIMLLKKILAKDEIQGDKKAEMLLRLAELYWEKARYIYLDEMKRFDAIYEKWVEGPDADKAPAPTPDNSESRLWNKKAVQIYRQILQNYPRFAKGDEALFYLAYNLTDLDERKEALEYYNRLTKTYPTSPFVPDAYLAIGEYYFDNNNAFKALLAYKKAASFTQSNVYDFSLYKLAWCYYNVGEYEKAIAAMKDVVAHADAQAATTKEQAKILLKEEALKDLVLFFSEGGNMEEAYEYFTRYGQKKYYREMLKRLASTFSEQGKNAQSIDTYKKLIAEEPMSRDAPSYQNEIIKAYWKEGKKTDTVTEIRKLIDTYKPGSAWARANEANKEAVEEANSLIEKNLRNIAIDYHKEAKKTKDAKTMELAHENYKTYLDLFPQSKHAYDMRFFFAELLYAQGKLAEAADEYQKVVEADPM